ncbi:hypothetical protein [Microbacterium sp.]|uniref:hypothetical protein n=1 Tax=Microbacterium sp. TaxID=51671 RepID=UPI0037369CD8
MTNTTGGTPEVPATADSGALPVIFQDLPERDIPRKRVSSWAMWDWAMQPFNTVILTFVWIALYLTSRQFLEPAVRESGLLADGSYLNCNESGNLGSDYCQGLTDLSEWWGWANFAAGILILLVAPVLGQQADARGSKKKWIIGATLAVALAQFSLFFVEADPRSSGSARSRWRSAPSSPRSAMSATTRCSPRSRPRRPSAASRGSAGASATSAASSR